MNPTLLLNYTYFLNEEKNAYISIGFDVNDFESKIIIFKNKKYIPFRWNDWRHLYSNASIIDAHFKTQNKIEIENIYGAVEMKLKNRKNQKEVSFGLKNVALNTAEWDVLQTLLVYFSEIMKWNKTCEKRVSEYYTSYVNECVRCNTISISSSQVLHSENNKSFNERRLHIEIPILMKEKLMNDYMQQCIFGFIE